MKKKGSVLKLRDTEELIGVYGVKDSVRLSSFGFIVKVKQSI